MKRQPSEWEKIIANETTDKALISKIDKQLIQDNTLFNTIQDLILCVTLVNGIDSLISLSEFSLLIYTGKQTTQSKSGTKLNLKAFAKQRKL